MSWWTLGPEENEEEKEEVAPIAPPLIREGRGGRGRNNGRGRGRGRSSQSGRGRGHRSSSQSRLRPPQLSDIPRQREDSVATTATNDEPESIFSTLGRTVNQYLGADNDDNTTKNTTGSAKYTNAPVKARQNANDAQLRANEMADAMAWLSSPAAAAAAAAKETTSTATSDNWWEKEDDAGIDDVSIFSNASQFKTGDEVPDLMTMLKEKQEENKKERERQEEMENDKKRKGSKLHENTKNAKQQAKKMGDVVGKWKDLYNDDGAKLSSLDVQIDPVEEMNHVVDWWDANKDYLPISDKSFSKNKKKAIKVRKVLDQVVPAELQAEKKARELVEAITWWQTQDNTYSEQMTDFERDQTTFLKVNDLFGGWELKGLPRQQSESFDSRDNSEEAKRRAKDLQGCLSIILNGYIDQVDPRYNSAAVNRIKDLFVDWKFRQDNSASELEEALRWWRLNASTFDPSTATDEDDEMFRKAKDMLALFGLKEGDRFDKRNKEMKEALKIWAKYKDTPDDKLDPFIVDALKKVKHALLQLHRNSLEAVEMQQMAIEMNAIMSWYREKGNTIQDLKAATKEDAVTFEKAHGLLTLWGGKVDPTPEQLKEIADSLIHFRRNHYKPEIFDQSDGEEGAKFKKLEQAMLHWRANSAESIEISPGEAEVIAKDIEGALDWWRTNSEDDDIPEFKRPVDVYLAEKVKIVMEKWHPQDTESTMAWKRTKTTCKEIQDTIDLWRDHGMVFDVKSLNIKPSQREILLKLREIMLEWRRTNASNISEDEAELTVKEMINAMNWWKKNGKEYDVTEESLNTVPTIVRHTTIINALEDWHSNLVTPKTEFEHLNKKNTNQTAEDLIDAMGWWERKGKNIEVDQDLVDADEFEKTKRLAQLWQNTNMPRRLKEQAVAEITNLFQGIRKKNKNFDLDAMKSEKVEDIREIFHIWGGKKDRKSKVVAREIEDALDWWKRNDFELDEDSSPAEEDKMQRLEYLGQRWHEIAHPNMVPGTSNNLDWFRNQNVGEISESLNLFGKAADPHRLSSAVLTEEQKRAKEMSSALDWLRGNDAELDIDDDASVALSVASFKKIDSLMPKSGESSGITSMESALNWLRSKTDVDDETVNSFKKIDSVIAHSGVKDSINESGFGGALDWLRKRQARKESDAIDDTSHQNDLIESDSLRPKTDEQKKAAEMAKALDWLRSNDAADDIEDDMSLGIGSVTSFKNIDPSSIGRSDTSLPSALDWLRKKDKGTVPTVDEQVEDEIDLALAGIAKKSKEEKSADDMAKALDWLRDGVVEASDEIDGLKSVGFKEFSPIKDGLQESSGIDEALNWLRKKHPDSLSQNDDYKFSTFESLDSLPQSKEQQQIIELNKALSWMRSNGVEVGDDSPEFLSYMNRYGSIDTEVQPIDIEGKPEDMQRALDWLRNNDANKIDADDSLNHFRSALKSKEQEQADAMAKALSWLRNKKPDSDGVASEIVDFEKFEIGSFSTKSEEERALGIENALNWLRKSDDKINIDESKFKKLDLLLPQKEGQAIGDRAKEMEDALNWLRSKGLDLDDEDDDVTSFDDLGIVSMGLRSSYERDRDMKDAIRWIRNADSENAGKNVFPQLNCLLPERDGQLEEDRANDMVNALAWLRANGVDIYDADALLPFSKVDPKSIVSKSPEERESDIEEALGWLRQGENKFTDDSVFSKIEGLLPTTKVGQSDLDRAKEMENALNWLRSNGIDTKSITIEPISQFGTVEHTILDPASSGLSSPNNVESILKWIRNDPTDDSLDPSGAFQTIESLLPSKKGQTPEERAGELANALNWIRQRSVHPILGDDTKLKDNFTKADISMLSPEQRSQTLDAILNWLRTTGDEVAKKSLDPSGDFTKLDSILPKRGGQTLEDRANSIQEALEWIREQGRIDSDDNVQIGSNNVPLTFIAKSTPEQRLKDLDCSLNWIRKGKNKKYDPTGDFRKLDKLLPKKRSQTPEERGREIEGALDFLRSNDSSPSDDDIIDKYSELGFIPVSLRTPEQRCKDLNDIVNWIRHKGENDKINDPDGEFRISDSVLPKKKGQTAKDRARQIETCLDWIRSSKTSTKDHTMPSFDNISSIIPAYTSPEQRCEDVENVLNWLRRKGKKDKKYDPTGDFRTLDKMLPKKKNQQLEDRARAIEGALDYIRNSDVSLDDIDAVEKLSKLDTVPVSARTPEQRTKDQQDVLNWLRNKENENLTDPTGEFKRIDSLLPAKKSQSLNDRAKDIEVVSDWMRHERIGGADYLLSAEILPTSDTDTDRRSTEQRSKDLSCALEWLRNKGNADEKFDPDGKFRRLDSMLPKKRGQTAEDRAREIEGALDWIRQKDETVLGDDQALRFDTVSPIPVSQRSIEQRLNDVDNILSWLRSKGQNDAPTDQTTEFLNLDSMLPTKQGQSMENRAREIERALDWSRNMNRDLLSNENDGVPDFNKVTSIPMSRRTPEERSNDISNILNWLRPKDDGNFSPDPSGDFTKLNHLLPQKAGQSLEDRARDIEGVLDYTRNHNIPTDDNILPALSKAGNLPISRRCPEERKRDTNDILGWIRQGKNNELDHSGDFKKLDDILPVTKSQSSKLRARDIESTLDWCRSLGIKPTDIKPIPGVVASNFISARVQSPEDRKKEIDNVLSYLRHKPGMIDNASTDYSKIDQMLPGKKQQTNEERARVIESTLDWLRMAGLSLNNEEDPFPSLDKLDSVTVPIRGAQERDHDLENILNWIRKGRQESNDPTGEFTKIDGILPPFKGEKARERAQKIERAIDWVRNKGILPLRDTEEPGDALSTISSIPLTRKSSQDEEKEVGDVLHWIRSGKPDNGDAFSENLKKIDQMLPVKKGQSPEDRAREINNALIWTRQNNISPSFTDDENDGFEKVPSVQVGTRTPEERSKDLLNVVNWLRNGKKSSDDDHNTFQKIDALLPIKSGQDLRDRAKSIENALDYCRNEEIHPFDDDDAPPSFSPLSSIPVSNKSPEERLKDVDAILQWLRSPASDLDTPIDFKKIDQILPRKKGQTPYNRARNIEAIIDYCRNRGVKSKDDGGDAPALNIISSIRGAHKSPEGRKEDIDAISHWIRSGKPKQIAEGTENQFSLIDQMLPPKKNQSPVDRAKDVECVLNWMRSNNIPSDPTVGDNLPQGFPFVAVKKRSPDDRQKDVNDIIDWIRDGRPSDVDSQTEFVAIDQMLPPKKDQNPDDRAKDIEGILNWIRSNNVPVVADDYIPDMNKMPSVPMNARSPEDRQKDVDDITDWIRNSRPSQIDLATNEFAIIDQMLQPKKNQSPDDRAREIESALNWYRVNNLESDKFENPFTSDSLPPKGFHLDDQENRLDDILLWMRNNKDPVDDADGGKYGTIDGILSPKKGETPLERAKDIENVLSFMRVLSPPTDVEHIDAPAMIKAGQIQNLLKSPEQRMEEQENILQWLRQGKNVTDSGQETFMQIDQLLPKKSTQTPDERAKEIESVIDWCRCVGVEPDTQQPTFDTIPLVPIQIKSPEDRQKDVDDITSWIRKGRPQGDDSTNEFETIDHMLPTKKNQSPNDRAKDVEGVLNWMRSNNVPSVPTIDDRVTQGMNKLPTVLVQKRSPENRQKDVDDITNWIRKGRPQDDDSTNEFATIDQMLPPKKNQSPDDRATDIEGVLNWMRSNNVPSVPTIDDRVTQGMNKLPTVLVQKRSPEDRQKDVDDITNWIRKGRPQDDDSTNEFATIDQMLPPKKNQSPDDRATDIEGVLNWMRSNNVPTIVDENTTGMDKVPFVPAKMRSPEDRQKDVDDITNWIRSPTSGNADSPTNEFTTIDQMLPPKKSQSPDDRAKDIEGVLNWMRSNNVPTVEDGSKPGIDTVLFVPAKMRSPEDRQKDVDDITNWIRSPTSGNADSPTNEFTTIDQMLPPKKSQSPDDRAKDIEGVLNWMRSNNVPTVEDGSTPGIDTVLFVPAKMRSPENRQKDVDDITNWIRNDRPSGNADSPFNEFTTIDQMLPPKKSQSPNDRAKDIEGVLNWTRSNNVPTVEDGSIPDMNELSSVPVQKQSPENRQKDVDDITNWIRNDRPSGNADTPFNEFATIDQMLPPKKNQSPDDRAKDVEGVLNWMRSNNVPTVDNKETSDFDKLSSVPVQGRSPEDRQKDVDDITNWIRNDRPSSNVDSPTDEFATIDQILPPKKNQSPDDRAKDVEGVLNWMRSNNVPTFDDNDTPGIDKISSVPAQRRSPEDRQKDVDDITNWIRNDRPSSNVDLPTNEFATIDQMLPSKKNQSPDDRAKDVEGVLNWMRSNNVPAVVDGSTPGIDKVLFVPAKMRSPEDRQKDVDDITNWIRNDRPCSVDSASPTNEFAIVDQILPPKKNQSPDDRAKDVESILNWTRTNNFPVADNVQSSQLRMPNFIKLSLHSPDERKADIDNICSWIRRGKKDKDDSPNGDFRKIDQLLPIRKQQSPDERARNIEGVLDWCRNTGMKPIEDDNVPSFSRLNSIPVSRRSPEERQNDLNNIVTWLREGEPDALDSFGDFKKISQCFPPDQRQSPEKLATDMERALDWTRNALPDENIDDETPPFSKLASIPVTRRTPEDRMNDTSNVLTWIRQGKDVTDDKTGRFEVLDQFLPKKPLQKPEERARDIESALDWARANNVNISPEDISHSEPMERQPASLFKPRSPQERLQDLDRTLNWMRNDKPNIDDGGSTGELRIVDDLLPKKTKETPEDRAADIENVLCWMRQNNMKLTDGDESPFKKVDQNMMPSMRSPEDRAKDLDDALTWVRHTDGADDPELEPFKTLDQLLPTQPGKSPLDRAKEIENAYTWLRANAADVVEDKSEPFVPVEKKVETNPCVDSLDANIPDPINNYNWKRSPQSEPVEDEDIPFNNPDSLNSIPRDRLVDSDESVPTSDWLRQPTTELPGVPDEDTPFDNFDSLNSIPRSRLPDESEPENFGEWVRNPNNNIPGIPDNKIQSDRPGDIKSLPRDGKPKIMNEPEYQWARKPIGGDIPGIPSDDDIFERPGSLNSIPRSKSPSNQESTNDTNWKRNPNSNIPGVQDENNPLNRIPRANITPKVRQPIDSDPENDLGWARSMFITPHQPNNDDPFDRPDTLNSIPRGREPEESVPDDKEVKWMRSTNIPGISNNDDTIFDRPGDVKSIPRDGRPKKEDEPETIWQRTPISNIPGIPDDGDVFDRPGDVKSVPRDGSPKNEDHPETIWQRTPNDSVPGIPDETDIYNRPGDVNSVPRDGKPKNEDHPETVWQRTPSSIIPGIPDEDDVYNRPGDVKSLPRDGKPKNEDHPETIWQRTPNDSVPGIPDETDIYNRPGDVNSVPRDGKPKSEDHPETVWQRAPSSIIPGVPNEDDVYNRPGDVNSVPRDGRTKSPGDPEYGWKRVPDNSAFSNPPSFDWAAQTKPLPFNRPNVTTPFESDDDFEVTPVTEDTLDLSHKVEQPFYDWAGGRPTKLRSYKKEEPQYDWSGARPEEPFDRPSVTASTESDNDLELNAIPDDDIGEYEEEDDDKKPTVTGVPIAAWSMLALGAVAGAGAAVGPVATVPSPSPNTPQFSLENPNQPSPTDAYFPDPQNLIPCTTDPACQMVSDALGPYIPPGTAELFDIPGTCQSKARDWLRTGEDVLEFNGERVRQRFAMTVFFCEQDGGEWLENDMWLSDLHECDWYNMIGLDPCNRVEQMEMLRISGNGLQGTLPSELSILSTIYEFTASDNLITGTFPPDYKSLTELDTLVVAFNQFSGEIPGYFFRYPDMVYWDVGFNKFEGTLPQDIPEKMPNLQVMFGENNQFSGTIPANLGTLDLKNVHFDDNNFTGTIPSTLGNPPNLETLLLHGNSFTGTIPEALPNKLKDATFHYNSLEGDVSKNICEQMYQGKLQSISVDCETVTCECCICGEPGI